MSVRARAVLGLLVCVPLLSGCAVQGLDFRTDTRLAITTPADRATVAVPFPLAWTLAAQQPHEAGFAVLVDVDPPAPGRAMSTLLPESQQDVASCDAACQQQALEARGVTLTTATSLVIDALPRRSDIPAERAHRHRLTVVVVDSEGRRAGEVSASVVVDEEMP